MLIHEIITEAPIQDFKTIGDFSKNSSFRDPRDRNILTHPRTIEIIKKKFNNTEVDINLYFVNSPRANKHTEIGEVNMEWVTTNLGEEVSSQINAGNDSLCVIFTNNKGSERVVMTPWIIAHRMAHVLSRNRSFKMYNQLQQAYGSFLKVLADDVLPAYGIRNFARNYSQFVSDTNSQKILQLFAYSVGKFNSARSKNIRNGFEVLHELFAQFIITGEISFNELPRSFGNRNTRFWAKNDSEYDDATYGLSMASEILSSDFDGSLHASVNKIYVM